VGEHGHIDFADRLAAQRMLEHGFIELDSRCMSVTGISSQLTRVLDGGHLGSPRYEVGRTDHARGS
jgi:hypothetical protein